MIDISKLSNDYRVRRMDDADADSILQLCKGNTLYYQYCQAQPTRQQVLSDLHITPPGIAHKDKYYIGFYQGNELIAVMDLIDGYPEKDIAFIGFFMVDTAKQGCGLGSRLIGELEAALRTEGFGRLRLAWVKDNPQAAHFWKKNGLTEIKRVGDAGGHTVVLAEKTI